MARPAATPTTKYGIRSLQIVPKCEGLDVWELQIKLLGWGSGSDNDEIGNVLDPVRVTGKFDSTTRDAVMRFQKALTLPVTGIVDSATFFAIDKEAALYPLFTHEMKCPCLKGDNDGPILCKCEKHDESGKCATGFGKGRFAGKYLLDGTSADSEKLDLYDKKEYDGIDKALLWAVRGLMRRAAVKRAVITAGYRCWEDNYHRTDELRWRHRKLTFHLGKALEFYHDGQCARIGAHWKNDLVCDKCERIRSVALDKCGFQLGWQEPNRVSVADGRKDAPPPAAPVAVHVNTVRRLDREEDDFVKTYFDSVQPLYAGAATYSFPVDLGEGTDPRVATSDMYYSNIETGKGGWYPVGASRIWHGGVHLHEAGKTEDVRAIADGEIVGFRVGEAEDKKAFGSRNFVLVRHEFNKKKYYSLYYHLDDEAADSAAATRWRRQIAIRATKHVEAIAPCPFFVVVEVTLPDGIKKNRLTPKEQEGLGPGELALAPGAEVDAKTIDDSAPDNSTVVKLSEPADTYVYTKLENKQLAKLIDAEAGLASLLKNHDPGGLTNPIRVSGGEPIGKIGAAATDETAAALGAFVHVEIFSDQAFITGDGWQQIDAGGAAKVPDRKAIVEELTGKKLLSMPPDGVLLDEDVRQPEQNVYRELARAVILKMPSEWDLDWKAAIRAPENLAFIEDRGALGDRFNEYGWWKQVAKAKAALPASSTVFHYHPIAAILAMAHA
jgi:hypothetical protein